MNTTLQHSARTRDRMPIRLAGLLGAALVLATLAIPTGVANAATKPTPKPTAKASTPAKKPAKPAPVKITGAITVWSGFTQGPRAVYMEKIARQFESDYPGTKVTIQTMSWGQFGTKWPTALATGQLPDVSTALPNQVVQMINVDALAPMSDLINSIGRKRFDAKPLSEGVRANVNYSLPLYSHAQVMWYRKDLLAKAGLSAPPQTWDELKAAAVKLTKDGVYGLSVPMGTNDLMASRFLNFYVQSGGESLINKNGTANLTSKLAIDGIKYWVDMYKQTSPKGSVSYNVLDQATLFYQGKTAFDFNSGFQISGVASTTPGLENNIAAAPLPRMKSSDPVYGGETSNIAAVVWKQSKNQAAAKAFLKLILDDKYYVEFLRSIPGGMLPVLNDVADTVGFAAEPTVMKFRDSINIIRQAIPLGTAIGMERGPIVQSGIIAGQGIIEAMFQDIVLNNKAVEQAAADTEAKLNQMFVASGAKFNR